MKQKEVDEIIKVYSEYYLRSIGLGDIPDNLVIDDYVFNLKDNNDLNLIKINNPDIKLVKLPNIINSIDLSNIFLDNSKIEKVILGDKVKRIGNRVFENNYYLKYINLENIKEIGNYSFLNCMSLEKLKLKNIVSIGIEAFSGCKSLVFVDLGGKLEGLSSFVFRQNPLLRKVVGTESLRTIDEHCFCNCKNLKTIDLHNIECLGDYAFGFCSGLLNINLSNIQVLGESCFFRCENLQTVYLSKYIEKLSKNLFFGCHHLSHVKNLENVKELDDNCFYGSGIKVADLRNCEKIGKEVFLNSNLSTIIISDKLKYIGDSSFHQNIKMARSTFRDDMKSELMSYFRNNNLIIKYYVDKENPLEDIIIGKNNDIFLNAKIIKLK